jgi:hypothetical protein
MRWMPAQIVSIIVEYAHDGEAYCPHDHTPLVGVVRQVPGSRQTVMVHICPTCGNDTSSALPQIGLSAA